MLGRWLKRRSRRCSMLFRMAIELGGAVLLAIFVPRLARSLGADPRTALWLAVLSPLVLLQLIGAGHNDALMAGLMVAGVAFAVQGRPALGVALCAVAATVKLPAALAALFIAVVWARSMPDFPHAAELSLLLSAPGVGGGVGGEGCLPATRRHGIRAPLVARQWRGGRVG